MCTSNVSGDITDALLAGLRASSNKEPDSMACEDSCVPAGSLASKAGQSCTAWSTVQDAGADCKTKSTSGTSICRSRHKSLAEPGGLCLVTAAVVSRDKAAETNQMRNLTIIDSLTFQGMQGQTY